MQSCTLDWQGLELVGSVHLPDGAQDAWLMLHGFTGQRLEFSYLFVEISRRLEQASVASLRFDFPGCGESEGEFADISVAQQVAVTRFLLSELPRRYPGLRWHLFGFSMGGLVALRSLVGQSALVHSLCLVAPAMNLGEVVAQFAAQGLALPDGRRDFVGLEIGQQLLAESAALDVWAGVGALALPVLVINGEGDTLVPVASGRKLAAALPHAAHEAWPEVDHVLARRSWRWQLAQRLVDWVNDQVVD